MSYYTVDNAVATPGYQALLPHRTARLVHTTEWSWTLVLRPHWNLVACHEGQKAVFHQSHVISQFLRCSLQAQLCQPRSPWWSLVPALELQQCHSFHLSEATEAPSPWVGAGLRDTWMRGCQVGWKYTTDVCYHSIWGVTRCSVIHCSCFGCLLWAVGGSGVCGTNNKLNFTFS